ncbi:MAG: ArnT family glycosyltransferase [Flavobacterium sp.]|jgi:hypothetical protein
MQKLLHINSKVSFSHFYITASIFVFIIVAVRSYLVPFNHDETATFFFYIQSGNFWPFFSHVDANNHVLNSFLSYLAFQLFGSSPFSLRLPNLLGLVILIIATYKVSMRFIYIETKVLFTCMMLFSFHWLSFFSACRGYGLSMALLLIGVTYMLDYLDNLQQYSCLLKSLLFFQLSISANLILIVVVLFLNLIVITVQLSNHRFFKSNIIILWIAQFLATYFWLSFSFYLQKNGALYYGEGNSYWTVTFVSLIDLILGFYANWMNYVFIAFLFILIIYTSYLNRDLIKNLPNIFKKPTLSFLFTVITLCLCLGFYLMNKFIGVNYPEDRTGLFFYLFFGLWVCFVFDCLISSVRKIALLALSALFVLHFVMNLNFRKHSLKVYETIPEHFYSTLLNEQSKIKNRITIGGHRVRELFYAFLNYRNYGELYSADPTEVMQMNCDYYIATKKEEKYFKKYYEIIDEEPDWEFVLLKRKEKITRNTKLELNNVDFNDNGSEFIEIIAKHDTTVENTNPILAEFDLSIEKMSVPHNLQVVFQVNDSLDQTVYFKRYPLQWSGDNLNGRKSLKCSIILGNLPKKIKKMVCFFWNIDQKPFVIKVNSLKIHQLEGNGVDFEAPDIE